MSTFAVFGITADDALATGRKTILRPEQVKCATPTIKSKRNESAQSNDSVLESQHTAHVLMALLLIILYNNIRIYLFRIHIGNIFK